ncbi:MAG: glycosyltransferase, partial [Campylobacteraceae bacterium]|nr:glycosyltransferase [Campylobacteraceae bacterium]
LGVTWLNHKNILTLPAALLQDIKEFREYRANNIKVSVIIPVYNVESYLKQCLDSVINQTLKDIEIICVDDGSTDNSLAILNEYAQKDKRITVLSQKNSGAGVARNRGLAIAKGEYIHFMDSDDYLADNIYDKLYNMAEKNDLDIIRGKAYVFDEEKKEIIHREYYELTNIIKANLLDKILKFSDFPEILVKTSVTPWQGLFKRKFLYENNILFGNLICVNDRSFWIKTLVGAKKLMYIDEYILYYRINLTSSLISKRDKHFDCHFLSYWIIEEVIRNLPMEIQDIILKVELADMRSWYGRYKNNNSIYIKDIEKSLKEFLKTIKQNIIPKELLPLKNDIPKVSVIIPVYNVEPYLRQCLNSVVNQTLKDIEIICVDDGSTDGSLAILNEYAQKDKRITVLSQKNSGAAVARNTALKIIKGEYFVFMDPDDFYPNDNVLSKLYYTVKEQNVLVCGGSLSMYDKDNNPIQNNFPKSVFQENKLIDFKDYQFEYYYQRFIYSARVLKDNNMYFPEYRRYEDPVFFIHYMNICKEFYVISDDVYCYRTSNKTHVFTAKEVIDWLKGLKEVLEMAKKYDYDKIRISTIKRINSDYYTNIFRNHIDNHFVKTAFRNILLTLNTSEYFHLNNFAQQYLQLPKVSLIIPVYNVEKYLRKCLDSAVNQTLKDIEIICVNDGSTDNSLNILREYEKKDDRIIVIDQKNGGLSASRNTGLDIAVAAYIMFIDSDDWIELDTLEAHYKMMTQEKVDITISSCISIPENDTNTNRHNNYVKYYSSLEKPEGKRVFAGDFKEYRTSAWCKLYKKDIIDRYNLRFPAGLINEDEAWHWYYFLYVKNVYYINKTHYNRLVRNNSIMSNREDYSIGKLDILYILENVYDYLQKNGLYEKYYEQYSEYFSRIASDVLKRCNGNHEFITQANAKIEALRKKISPNIITDEVEILHTIKDVLQDKVLLNAQFKHDLRIWDDRIVVINIFNMKMSYDVKLRGHDIVVGVMLRENCDKIFIHKFYPNFPENKNYIVIYKTPITSLETSFVDFIKNEIDRVVTKSLTTKQAQSA